MHLDDELALALLDVPQPAEMGLKQAFSGTAPTNILHAAAQYEAQLRLV